MADNDENTLATGDVSDADIQAALLAGGHLPEESSDVSGGTAEENLEEGDQGDKDHEGEVDDSEDQLGGENAEEGEETGGEASEGAEDTSEETGDETPELPPKSKGIADMEKRIDKLTAIRRDLEEENRTLKERLETAQPIKLQATSDEPLADLDTEEELQKRTDQMLTLTEWCYENLDGGEAKDPDGNTVEYSPKEVRQRLAAAQKILAVSIPKRRQYLQQRAQWDNATRAAYPQLYDSKSQESRMASAFLQQCPGILKMPNYQMIIGDAIRGMNDRLSKEKAAKAAPKKEPIAPRAAKPSQPPQRVAKTSGNPMLERRLKEGGSISTNELAKLLQGTF
jgi:hypothetical protein